MRWAAPASRCAAAPAFARGLDVHHLGRAAPPALCRLNAETPALYEVLLAAARREEPGVRAACRSHAPTNLTSDAP